MNRFLLPGLIGWMLLVPLAGSVQAVDTTTSTVMGRAPVASNVAIVNESRPGEQPRANDLLRVSYNFLDIDGDGESGTTYKWIIRGANFLGSTYRVWGIYAYESIRVEVTPKTNSATTDPSSGTPATSAAFLILPANVGRFLAPDSTVRNWTAANMYCQGLGNRARLPTKDELKKLFLDVTGATAVGNLNIELCNKYGWPLDGVCRGSQSNYWSSTPYNSAGVHYYVNMVYGYDYSGNDSQTKYVACVR